MKWDPPEDNLFLYSVLGYILQSSSGKCLCEIKFPSDLLLMNDNLPSAFWKYGYQNGFFNKLGENLTFRSEGKQNDDTNNTEVQNWMKSSQITQNGNLISFSQVVKNM